MSKKVLAIGILNLNQRNFARLALMLAGLFLATCRVGGASMVSNVSDSGAGSLRATVAAASPGSTITFVASLSGQTILLTSGELLLTNTLTIDASALPAGIVLNGGSTNRAFNLGGTANITLIGLTVTNCYTPDAGGALYSSPGSTLHISRCTFTGNSGLEGGAILVDGHLTADDSTFFGNYAPYGGALQCRSTTFLTHCTFSQNNAPDGGGGIYNKSTTLTLNNCIVAGNTSAYRGADIASELAALVYTNANLIQVVTNINPSAGDAGPAPLTGAPLLFPPGNYGGPTPTMPPNIGSPAIDAGGLTSLTVDQRGLPRTVGAHPDLGAVELQAAEAFYNPVLSTADAGPWTLRGAIAGVPSGTSITFATNLAGQTITLTSSPLLVNNNLTITGLGATNLAISGNNARAVFNIGSGYTVNISGLTIENGLAASGTNSSAANGPGGVGASGGGILNNGTLNLTNCALVSNASGTGGNGYPPVNPTSGVAGTPGGAGGNGGAIANQGILRMSGCTLAGNLAGTGGLGGFGNFTTFVGGTGGHGGSGAGLYNAPGASATVLNCTFYGNTAGSGGYGGYAGLGQNNNPGGIDGNGGNGGGGGAAYSAGTLALTSCTLSGNNSGAGGAAGQFGSGPAGPGTNGVGGGVLNGAGAALACDNNIIALNASVSDPDVAGAFNSLGHNLIGETNGSIGFGATSDLLGSVAAPVNPLVGSLQLNGGQTATLALQLGSPAIEAGDDSLVGTDQRGFPRPIGAHVDIGACELDISGFPALVVAALGQTLGTQNPVTGDYPVTFTAAVNPGGLVTVASVQYGLTTNYGGSGNLLLPTLGLTTLNLTNVISVFAPGIVYHYRIFATNMDGFAASPDNVFQLPAQYLLGDANGDGIVSQQEFNQVLANYLATSPSPFITDVMGLGQPNVSFALAGATAGSFIVQASTNLVDWQNLGPATPRYFFTDTNTPLAPHTYYRLAAPTAQ